MHKKSHDISDPITFLMYFLLWVHMYVYHQVARNFYPYRIAGKFGEHYIWRISQWKIFGDFNFGDDLPARLNSRTYKMYRYRHACAATKDWRVFKLTTLTQIRQTAKINSSPNFPAIRYIGTVALQATICY